MTTSLVERAHRAADVYAHPDRYASKHQFLAVLTDSLDELCVSIGKPLPDVPAAFSGRVPRLFELPPATTETSLKRVLATVDMSQSELSERSGVTRETICKIVNGHVWPVRVSVAVALAWALDTPLATIADLIDELPLGPRSGRGVYR